MRLYTKLPRVYEGDLLEMPILNKKGKITQRTKNALENTLFLYSTLAKEHARIKDNNPKNYLVERVSIIGSGARNKVNSDIDLMLIAPKIDLESADNLKLAISYVLFCDRSKQEAIDVFIRAKDKYPKKRSKDITSQIKEVIDKYNFKILKQKMN